MIEQSHLLAIRKKSTILNNFCFLFHLQIFNMTRDNITWFLYTWIQSHNHQLYFCDISASSGQNELGEKNLSKNYKLSTTFLLYFLPKYLFEVSSFYLRTLIRGGDKMDLLQESSSIFLSSLEDLDPEQTFWTFSTICVMFG